MKIKNSILSSIILSALLFGSCNNAPKGNYNLDLTLEVSVESILKALSSYNTDEIFLTSLARTKELQKQNQDDYVTLFGRAFQEIDPNARLAAIFLSPEMRDKINYNSTNDEVLAVIRNEVNQAILIVPYIIKTRIQNYGLSKSIKKFEISDNKMHLEISGIDNPERFKKLLTASNKLEFWETYENEELIGSLSNTNEVLRDMRITIATDTTETITQKEFTDQNPLFGILRPRVDNQGQPLPSCMIGLALGKDTAKVNSYLKMIPIRALFPRDIKFYWSKNPHKYDASKSLYELHAIKPKNGGPLLSGEVFVYAKASLDKKSSNVKINLKMYEGGARRLASITRFNIGRCIAIVVDDYVRSYPRVMTQITGGKTEITGDFTIEEADDLCIILKSGQLPAEIKIVQEQVTKGE